MADCDLCGEPVQPGQPRFGGFGTGGADGARIGSARHYACHVDRFGRVPPSPLIRQAVAAQTGPAAKVPAVTKGPTNYSPNAAREFTVLERVREMGRTRVRIRCPFCLTGFWAFIWSLSGGGKRCPSCRAMHASHGQAYPLEGNEGL